MNELSLNRRGFLKASAAAGGGLMLGFHLPGAQAAVTSESEVNAWIVIKSDDTVIVRVAHSEMGQGSFTALPMLVAEELECDWNKVKPEFVRPTENLARKKVYGPMATVGSRAVRTSHEFLRVAGASAREMLIAAAAASWKVPANECRAANSVITHLPSNRTVTFGAVAAAAAKLTPPHSVVLKDPKVWKIAGKPMARFDIEDKVMAKPIYAIDVKVHGMLHAAIVQCPVFGGKLKSYDESALKDSKGVHAVVNLGDAVAVVADNHWRAEQAIRKLPVVWDEGPNARVSNADIAAFIAGGLKATDAAEARNDGDVKAALKTAAKVVEATYNVPFLSHAPMEPMNCTVHFNGDTVEVWAPTQNIESVMNAVATTAGMDPMKVVVHPVFSGGGFGRRGGSGGTTDYIEQATRIAKAVGKPVKLVWSREEDMRHDYYRPISSAKFTAGLDADGNVVAWDTRIAGQSILATSNPSALKGNLDMGFLVAFTDNPYTVPNLRVDYGMRNTHVPAGYWRSVNHSQNGYFRECFVDELAKAANADPYEFRRKMLSKAPKQLAVLDAAAKAADWTKPLPKGMYRGIAQVDGYGSYVAAVAEISMTDTGMPKVHRFVCAVDCGHVVNPDTVRSQMEGAIVWGLSAALYGEITIKDGRVEQGNFDSYRMLKLAEMPKVEVIMVPTFDFWGGIGEPGAPIVAPALVNAMFAATGKPVRSLPIMSKASGSA